MPAALRALSLALLVATTASAQLIPWTEPPTVVTPAPVATSAPTPALAAPATKPKAKAATTPDPTDTALPLPPSSTDSSIWSVLSTPSVFVLTSFAASDPGAVRADSSWVGQVTQNTSSITVAGTAADDNGWGATGLALNAATFTSLSITAQRNVGNETPTLFLQFEDRNSLTKVYSINTSLFAFGTLTTVQIPLTGWTVDFGPSDIAAWNIGGGSVGTIPFRMSFDEISFGTSAIPEPSTYAALLGALALLGATLRRRR